MKNSINTPETPDPDQLDLAFDVEMNTRDPDDNKSTAENPLLFDGGFSESQLTLAKHLKELSLKLKIHPPAQEQ